MVNGIDTVLIASRERGSLNHAKWLGVLNTYVLEVWLLAKLRSALHGAFYDSEIQ